MKIRLSKLMVVLVAVAIFIWFKETFFPGSPGYIRESERKVEVASESAATPSEAVKEVVMTPEPTKSKPSNPSSKPLTVHERRRMAAEKELKRRAMSEAQKVAMRAKWKSFYKPSPMCKSRSADWDIVVRCANELLRANEDFEQLHADGKL